MAQWGQCLIMYVPAKLHQPDYIACNKVDDELCHSITIIAANIPLIFAWAGGCFVRAIEQ